MNTVRTDPKPRRRVRDPELLKKLHANPWPCVSCGRENDLQIHHILSRAQRGDDAEGNCIFLCSVCHSVLHDDHPRRGDFGHVFTAAGVRQSILSFLRSEAGDDARWYLTRKLGVDGSRAWVERTFGEAW